jgi:hypothetical protein
VTRRTRHATDAVGDGAYPALVNQGYVSDYFLAYRLEAGLGDLYDRWTTSERDGHPTPRTRLRGLTTALAKHRAEAAKTAPDDTEGLDTALDPAGFDREALEAQRELCGAVAEALGWTPDGEALELTAGNTVLRVEALHVRRTPSGLLLVLLPTVFATDPAALVASKHAAAGTLLDPIMAGDAPVARTALEAAQALFTVEDAPDYLLLCSGGAVTLLDRARWGEGAYLGANLDDAASRADVRARGELAAIAALFSSDAIDPGADAQSPLTALVDKAANESAGVSKELRHGMRRSVELLANAVVEDLRTRQKRRWQDIDAAELTRECLRYLYRIIVLLFAEARPELGIVPADHPDYQAGYSVARLRDVALADLHGPVARDANHIQRSLAVLFKLVNDGYQPDVTLGDVCSIEFPGLGSSLFSEDACPMLDRARLSDATLQQVLMHLCFTREQRNRRREVVSFATLGINQLGAVYEGLMAYRGFLATEELYEIAKDADPDSGTWVVPVADADDYPDGVFVTEPGPDGELRRVRYREGDFVYRLSGRDRQRSASYYTPEVLTEFTVRHALDVYEEEHPDMQAQDWLALTVCEPALGSGAFANEAISQLAGRYLKSAQRERGERIDPDRYPIELQKAKAHFAINRTYGVDLNGTAVELAEVSLWLNVMHEGLRAPRFDARLRRGNSLIGARRASYTPAQSAQAPWKGTSAKPVVPPTDHPLHVTPLGVDVGIHHFLLPGEGWGAAADAAELKGGRNAKGLADEWSAAVRAWRTVVQKAPSKAQVGRLHALARRVEKAWAESSQLVAEYMRMHERRIDVWGAGPVHLPDAQATRSGTTVDDLDGPVARLKLVMDAWCALWLWAPEHGAALPTLGEWIDAIELLFGQRSDETGTLFSLGDTMGGELGSVGYFGRATVDEVLDRHPWLRTCRTIADDQAFFHWELIFAPVFAAGGFGLQVGNPPWVRLDWDDAASLAEHDPWWGVADLTRTADQVKRDRRERTLANASARSALVADRAENEGLAVVLGATTREPYLVGLRTNLYMLFMTNAWRRAHPEGTVGLLHPESHFVDPKGGPLREATYGRLRRHWQFVNELFLFSDVDHHTEFGAHVYGSPRPPRFLQAVNLLTPSTADRSLDHDGSGDLPGIQYPEGGWDMRPHAQRVVTVDRDVLVAWVALFDVPGTPAGRSRLLRPLTQADLEALRVFARQPRRLGDSTRYWTAGFNEKLQKDDGTFEWRTAVPSSLEDCVLQGPHILNATPFAQQPRENCRNNLDWEALDLETLPPNFVPRTNYQRVVDRGEFVRRQPAWDGEAYSTRLRQAHREFVPVGGMRTLQACVLPPGPVNVHAVNAISLNADIDTLLWGGALASLPYDFLVKVAGASHITARFIDTLPLLDPTSPLSDALLARVARLNALTVAYGRVWSEVFRGEWSEEEFVAGVGTCRLGGTHSEWTPESPLRTDLDRWLALTEIDAIVALMLGLSEEQLLQMYRSQFAVLRKYEYVTAFDANGRQISGIHHNYGYHQRQWEDALKAAPTKRGERKVGMWDRVQAYLNGDSEVDLGPFVPPFVPADRELAMSRAYRAFEARLAAS